MWTIRPPTGAVRGLLPQVSEIKICNRKIRTIRTEEAVKAIREQDSTRSAAPARILIRTKTRAGTGVLVQARVSPAEADRNHGEQTVPAADHHLISAGLQVIFR